MSRRTWAVISLLFFAVACVAAGCAAGPERAGRSEGRTEPASVRLPKVSAEARRLVLPFDRYVLSLGEYYTVSNASDLLVEKCMKRHGYDWERIDRPLDAAEAKNRRRYGVIESAVADRFGYHAPEKLLNPYDVRQREEARERKLTAGAKAAALSSGDGCVALADKRLSGGREPDYDKLSEFDARIFENAQKVPAVEGAFESWSACMREAGFEYDEPDEAVRNSRWWSEEPGPGESAGASRLEKATASADVRCKERSDLVRLWYGAEKKLERRQIEETPAFFRELASVKEENLRNARKVVNGG